MDLILYAYIADFVFGTPQWFPHPVRLIGRFISFLEKRFNVSDNKVIQRFYGVFTVVIVIGISGICAYTIIEIAQRLHPIAGKIVWVFLAYTTLAIKDLSQHAGDVWKMLTINDIGQARKKLSLIVGRDTQELSQEEIISATVETVAESTTDGIVAPLFYLFLGGPVLAIIFKAISTLDSMLGHKEERYLHFGWCAAKCDTLTNFIPARITGLLIPIAALFCGKDFRESFRIMIRDGKKQDSLNSAVSEAAMAGALGIQIGGTCRYSGKVVEHPYLGEQQRQMSITLIKEAITLSKLTSLLMLAIGILFKEAVIHLCGVEIRN